MWTFDVLGFTHFEFEIESKKGKAMEGGHLVCRKSGW